MARLDDDLTAIANIIAGYVEEEPEHRRDRNAPPMYTRAQVDTLARLIIHLALSANVPQQMLIAIERMLSRTIQPKDPHCPEQVKAVEDYTSGRNGLLVSARCALHQGSPTAWLIEGEESLEPTGAIR